MSSRLLFSRVLIACIASSIAVAMMPGRGTCNADEDTFRLPGTKQFTKAASKLAANEDIPWEAEFPSYLAHVAPGGDPDVVDLGNGVPDYWDMALRERAISDVTTPGHAAEMLTAYSANYAALQAEATPQAMQDIGYLAALAITGGGFNETNGYFQTYYGFSLTSGLYTQFAVLDDNGDLDSDTILNKDEQGTDVASYVAAAITPNPLGEIAWEVQWDTLAPLIGLDPNGNFVHECPVPDRWVAALMAYVVVTPGVLGHDPAMMTAFQANRVLLTSQNAAVAAAYGDLLALSITADRFADANAIAQITNGIALTDSGYTKFPVLAPTGDLDGDAVLNGDETGATLEEYLFNATAGVEPLVEGGDIPWEAQWEALCVQIGFQLDGSDVLGGPVPDRWLLALMEYVTTTPGVAGHAASMVTAFNANKMALIQESPEMAAGYSDCVALLMMAEFEMGNVLSMVLGNAVLTEGLYTLVPVLRPGGDVDGDAVLNRNEAGATLPAFLGNATGGVQPLVEGGDIPWESQWEAMATALGLNPDGNDVYQYGVPDRWLFTLMANVISTPGVAGHEASMVAAFNANKLALIQENPTCAALYSDFTVIVIMSDFDDGNFVSQVIGGVTLNPALYTEFPILRPSGDVDGDYVRNRSEGGSTIEEFLANATDGMHLYVEGEDLSWEAQFQYYVNLVGPAIGNMDPNTIDAGNGVPDLWEMSLAERVVMDPLVSSHETAMVTAFNQNLRALRSEVTVWVQNMDVLASLAITSGGLDVVSNVTELFYGITLTESLYTQFAVAGSRGDADDDGIENQDEAGTDAASFVLNALTPSLVTEGGDIPWEAQWQNYVDLVGPVLGDMDPNTIDGGNGVPDYWESALAERVIMDSAVAGHAEAMLAAFNQNLVAIRGEVGEWVNHLDVVAALAITAGSLEDVGVISQFATGVILTEGLYVQFPVLYRHGDLDGDAIQNEDENGTDAASYILNATTPFTFVLTEGGDIPWESQWPIYVSLVGPIFNDMNPQTLDAGDGVPDYWQGALMERVIVDPSAPGHQAGMVAAFNANFSTYKSENPQAVTSVGCLSTLGITANSFLLAQILSMEFNNVVLTENLYTGFSGTEADADLDGDGIANGQEYGYDATSYVSNVLTGVTPIDIDGGTVSSYGGLDLIIPPSAFEGSTPITILQTLLEEGTFVTADDEEIDAIVPGGTFQVSGLENLRSGQSFTIVLEYPDANQDGLVDGTIIEELNLVILLRIPNTNEMVNLGGAVDTVANTVTATVTYDDLNAPPSGKQYETVRGISKDVGDETFVLAAIPRNTVPLSPWASVVLAVLILFAGVARGVRRGQRYRNFETD